MIHVRAMLQEDLPEIMEWFKDRKWPRPPAVAMLPSTAFVAYTNKRLVAVSWVYLTNSRLAMVDWVATNPKEPFLGMRGLQKIVEFIKKETSGLVDGLIHFATNDKLSKFFEKRLGFKRAEKHETMFWVRGG